MASKFPADSSFGKRLKRGVKASEQHHDNTVENQAELFEWEAEAGAWAAWNAEAGRILEETRTVQ